MNILLKREWNRLKRVLEYERNYFGLDSVKFTDIVLNFGIGSRNFRDKNITEQYRNYVGFYENLDIRKYNFGEKWYDFDNLLDKRLFKILDENSDYLISEIGRMLMEIFVFKSDIPDLSDGYYRIYSNISRRKIFYIADTAGPCMDMDLNIAEINEKVIPATAELVKKYKIKVCSEFDSY